MASITARGIKETRSWLDKVTEEIEGSLKETITSAPALSGMEARAKQDVEIIVYAAYDPKEYQRTFELLNGVGAVSLSENPPAAGILIALTPGTEAVGTKGVSYASFMLPEFSNKSWLQETAPNSIPRDFLSVWLATFSEFIPPILMARIDGALSR